LIPKSVRIGKSERRTFRQNFTYPNRALRVLAAQKKNCWRFSGLYIDGKRETHPQTSNAFDRNNGSDQQVSDIIYDDIRDGLDERDHIWQMIKVDRVVQNMCDLIIQLQIIWQFMEDSFTSVNFLEFPAVELCTHIGDK
jgi:hypothetical protein